MKTKKMIATLVVALLSVTAVMAKDFRTVVFKVAQMECAKVFKFEKGLKNFTTDLKERTVTITYDAEKTNVEKLKEGFRKFKYEAVVIKEAKETDKK